MRGERRRREWEVKGRETDREKVREVRVQRCGARKGGRGSERNKGTWWNR